jgi:hypothetical protein
MTVLAKVSQSLSRVGKSEIRVGGYQSTVLYCIAKRRYQATTSEDNEDAALAVVNCRVCLLANVL